MVKGISRQVIVVDSPEEKLFEQAIFILKEGAPAVTDADLLKEAKDLLRSRSHQKRPSLYYFGPAWACGGALITGLLWLMTVVL